MAGMTLLAQPMAMATTQLVRAVRYENPSWQMEGNVERTTLRMSWVVVTDNRGRTHLQMQWVPSIFNTPVTRLG